MSCTTVTVRRSRPRLKKPSPTNVSRRLSCPFDKHWISHIPYRHWCPHCLVATGCDNPHVTVDHAKRAILTLAMDYMFFTTKGVKFKNGVGELSEVEQKGALKVLIVRDLRSKAVFAHAVENEGLDAKGYIVDAIVANVLWTGYSKVLLNSDSETLCFRYLPGPGNV